MNPLRHREFHEGLGAQFGELASCEIVTDYGDLTSELGFVSGSAGVLDFSFRGRICALGNDRAKFLHGQLTNDINRLQPGQGCYSALVTNKGKLESDLNVHCLENEILLDFEPGLTERVKERIERFIVADDVELCDVSDAFGLLSVQGPNAAEVVTRLKLSLELPKDSHGVAWLEDETLGALYVVCNPRLESVGFDIYAPEESIPAIADKLMAAAGELGGGAAGWSAFETARVLAGVPRFGCDMTESNLAPEAGIAERAISYNKGCYIGQEVLNRLHNFAEVNKSLRVLRIDVAEIPNDGDPVFDGEKQVGEITSAVREVGGDAAIALGYVRKGHNELGTKLRVGEAGAEVVGLPLGKQR